MSIVYNEKERIFHLQASATSYILQIFASGHVCHVYWGKKIKNLTFRSKSVITNSNYDVSELDPPVDVIPQEYPGYGNGDFRSPAYQVQLENGTTVCDLRFDSYRIMKGKPKLNNLPSTYAESDDEAETLEITLVDDVTDLMVLLSYTVFENLNVITRSARFFNNGTKPLKLLRALSMSIDFDNSNYDMLQLSGAWSREKHLFKRALVPGLQAIESRRGISSHQQNPFIALMDKAANETMGEVYGVSLVYSGNFLAQIEVDQHFTARLSMGINPFEFSWLLDVGKDFQIPEVVMVYSHNGLGEMSRTYHQLYRTRLCRGLYRDRERPILVNNWEATYFNFNSDKIKSIAKAGKELGIELFVLDDGWFGKRDSDNCSLGDWVVDKNKLPNGLDDLANYVNNQGMLFGLWFEPEMVSPDSDLYRNHPDYCIHVPNRKPAQGKSQRNQLILDLSRDEVCDEIIRSVSTILKSAPISYVKWDMNRSISDLGSAALPSNQQRELSHRYVLGLYRILEEITTAFPEVLFESCCSGGGRFDPGMLYYMPQTWTSDDTDGVERLKIQYGTSIVYPSITMGAHVSTVPNHQVGRITNINFRGDVAMAGNFGYELDLTKFTEEEKSIVITQVDHYKSIRHIIQFGDFYRLKSPFEGNETAWMYITPDKTEAYISYFKILGEAFTGSKRIKLTGLASEFEYEVIGHDIIAGGDELMNIGLDTTKLYGDFSSITFRLKAI